LVTKIGTGDIQHRITVGKNGDTNVVCNHIE